MNAAAARLVYRFVPACKRGEGFGKITSAFRRRHEDHRIRICRTSSFKFPVSGGTSRSR